MVKNKEHFTKPQDSAFNAFQLNMIVGLPNTGSVKNIYQVGTNI